MELLSVTKKHKIIIRLISIILIMCLSSVSVFATCGAKIATKSVTKSVNQFDDKISYEDAEGYSGVLKKDGEPSSTVVSGSFIPGVSKTITEHAVNTGTTVPSSTWQYVDGEGYSGMISRVRFENNPVNKDNGYEGTINQPRFFQKDHENTRTDKYNANGTLIETTFSWDNIGDHPVYHVNEDGYEGDIDRVSGYKVSGPDRIDKPDGSYSIVTTYKAFYEGTLTKKKVWVPVIVQVDDYTGYYSGTVYTTSTDTRVWEYTQNYRGGAFTKELKERNYGNHGNITFDGDPVNVVLGNYYVSDTDLSIIDRGLPIEINRHYNSIDQREGLLGKSWRFGYDSTAIEDSISGNVKIIYPDGHTVIFEPIAGTNTYIAPQPIFDQLIKNVDGTYTLRLKNKLVNRYGSAGKLISITDKNGNTIGFSYNQNGELDAITGAGGITLDITCEGGKIKSITDPIGRSIVYTYNSSNNLIQVKGIAGGTITYAYDANGLKSITDQNGKKYIENEYDSFGRIVRQYDENQNITEYSYDEQNWENTCTFVTSGTMTKYQYNENMYVTKQTYSDGTYEEYTYDQWGNKNSIRNRNGNTTNYTYDSRGNLLEIMLPEPYSYTFSNTYDSADNLLQTSTPEGALSTYSYDANSNLERITQKLDSSTNAVTEYNYDQYGRLETIIDAEGNTTNLEYGNSNLPVKIIDTELNETAYVYDAVNRCISVTTDNGTTTYEYNNNDKIEKITDALGNVTRMKYDVIGNLITLINPEQYNSSTDDGSGFSYTYDGLDRLIKQIDPLGNVIAVKYNQEGKKIKEINPNDYNPATDNGNGIGFEYDNNGRVIRIVNPSGQKARLFYDPAGNRTKIIDANNYDEASDDGQGIQYIYNSLNQLVETRDTSNNIISRMVYNQDGRLVKEIDAQGFLSAADDNARYGTLYSYNAAGWLVELREPQKIEGGTVYYRITRYTYDKTGKLITEKKSQQYVTETGEPSIWNTISYTYYKNGRVKSISDSAGAYMEYTYDATGKTIEEKSKINETTESIIGYTYDNAGRVQKIWREIDAHDLVEGGSGKVFAETLFEYDKNGNITKMTRPEGYITTFEYDNANRLIAKHEEVSEDQISVLHSRVCVSTPKSNYYNGQQFDSKVVIEPEALVKGFNIEVAYDARVFEFKGFTPLTQGILIDGGVTGKVQIRATNANINAKTELASIKFKVKDSVIAKGYIVISPSSTYTDSNGDKSSFSEAVGKTTQVSGPDLNEDGTVGTNDFTPVAKYLGTSAGTPGFDEKYDINQDGIVDGKDLDYMSNYLLSDSNAQILEMARFSEKSTSPEYKANSNTVIRTTRYQYDKAGNVVKEIDCNNRETVYTYNLSNRLEAITDKSGNTTKLFYDEVGNVIKEVLPENYDAGLGDGVGTSYVYDTMNRLDKVIDASGNVIRKNIYNVNGWVIKEIDATGYLSASTDESRYGIEYTYDIGGRINSIQTPEAKLKGVASASYTYDAMNNVVAFTDGEDNTTTYQRDLWGRITKVTDPKGINTLYTYDYAGNVTSTTDGNVHTTKYSYNSLNRLATITDPLNQLTTYKYDREGRVAQETNRNGQDMLFQYNSDNNLSLSSIVGKNETERYYYYRDGSLLATANTTVIDLYQYNSNGYLQKKSRNGEDILQYEYNKNGSVTSVKDKSGQSTSYTYDVLGRLKTVNANDTQVATYDYNEDSTLKKISYDTGIRTTYGYDKDKNITSLVSQKAQDSIINQFNYTYDNNGNQLAKDENGQTTTYTYDELNRLSTVNYADVGVESFTYDNAGNRLTKALGNESVSYTYDKANRMLQSVSNGIQTIYTYDPNGNLLSEKTNEQTKTYTYDGYNRVKEVIMPDGQIQQNQYDVFGMRISTEENGKHYDYIYDRGSIISEYNSSGELINRNIRGYGLLAQYDGSGSMSYYLHNAHGDVVNLVDGNGDILNSYQYDAFGNTTSYAETVTNRFRYAGEQFDEITGQYYLRARYYQPTLGRFTQEDTYRGDGLNLYAYVANNPVNFIDPSGHAKCEIEDNESFLQPVFDVVGSAGLGLISSVIDNIGTSGFDVVTLIKSVLDLDTNAAEEMYTDFHKDKDEFLSYLYSKSSNDVAFYAGRVVGDAIIATIGTVGTINGISKVITGTIGVFATGTTIAGAVVCGGVVVAGIAQTAVSGNAVRNAILNGVGDTKKLVEAIKKESGGGSNKKGIGGKGWRGDKKWKTAIKQVADGGTIKDIDGQIPTQQEAIDLINEAGGDILRIEGPHEAPNPHNFHHINYTTPSGGKGTIKILP